MPAADKRDGDGADVDVNDPDFWRKVGVVQDATEEADWPAPGVDAAAPLHGVSYRSLPRDDERSRFRGRRGGLEDDDEFVGTGGKVAVRWQAPREPVREGGVDGPGLNKLVRGMCSVATATGRRSPRPTIRGASVTWLGPAATRSCNCSAGLHARRGPGKQPWSGIPCPSGVPQISGASKTCPTSTKR